MTLATLLVKLVGDATQLDAELKRSQRQLAATSAQWQQFGSSLQQIGAQLTAAVSVPLAGLGAVALKTAGELEQNTIAFKTMLGSAERAGDHLSKLRDFAMRTPFQFTDLVMASKRLQALGFTAGEVLPTLKAVGNATAALGTGADGIQRITLALGQMSAKGKVQAEEMRQLAEAGIPAWEILAKTLKTDVSGAMALVEKRAVDSATAIPAILAGINQRFGGLMDEQSKTLLGRWSNFKDQMTKILSDIGAALTPVAGRLMDAMANLGKEAEVAVGKFRALPQVIQDAGVAIGALAIVAGPALFIFGQMATGFSAVITLGSKLSGILGLAGLAGAVTALGTAAAVIGGAIVAWKLGEAAIAAGKLASQLVDLGKAAGPIRTVTDWIGRMAKALDDFYEKNGGRPNIWASILPGFGALDQWLGMFLDRTSDLREDATAQLKRLGDAGKATAADLREKVDKEMREMATSVKAAHDKAAEAAAEFAKKLAHAYSSLGIESNKIREIEAALAFLAQRQKKLGESVPAMLSPYAILRRELDASRITMEQFSASIRTVGEEMQKAGKVRFAINPEEFGIAISDLEAWINKKGFKVLIPIDLSVSKLDLYALNQVLSQAEGARNSKDLAFAVLGDPESWMHLTANIHRAAEVLGTLSLQADIAAGRTALAFETLGIKSQSSLRELADKAVQAYDEIRTAGTSTPIDIQRAWAKMVEAQIEAGEKLPKATLEQYERVKAATGSATKQLDKQWRGVVQQISTAFNDLARSFTDVIFGTKKISEAFEDLGKTIVRIILEQVIANAIGKLMKALGGVLDHLGGVMSPEMETPKLMWLEKHLPDTWSRAGHFFDLADFLTWKASGSNQRSQCALACKWTYLAHEEPGWRRDFFDAVGIPDMLERGNLPERASPVGADLGPLTAQAAAELGLTTGCRVGAGMIDAYAGALGVLAAFTGDVATIDRHTINNNQGRTAATQGRLAPDADLGSTAGSRAERSNIHTGHLALQGVHRVGRPVHRKFIRFYVGRRITDTPGLFGNTQCGYHYLTQVLGVIDQHNRERGPVVHGHFLAGVANGGKHQHGISGRCDGKIPVGIGTRSTCTTFNSHADTRKAVAAGVAHRAGNGLAQHPTGEQQQDDEN